MWYNNPLLQENIKKSKGYRRIKPDQVFSFNEWIGVPSGNKGFKKVPVIDDSGEFVARMGGGICQVSTTLYNAVKEAGLTIVERHSHSIPINYVKKGQDATIVPGEKDFRFKNSKDVDIIIRCSFFKDRFMVEILSK